MQISRKNLKPGQIALNGLFYVLIGLVVVIAIAPFLWLIITSLKLPENLYKRSPDLLPLPATFDNYIQIFGGNELWQSIFNTKVSGGRDFGQNILNSLFTAILTTIGCLALGILAGYALGRVQFPGRRILLGVILAVSMFPGIAIIAPLFLFFRNLQLINQLPALLLPYITFNLPLTVWLLAAFFRDLPTELEEAAEVDGAHPFTAFRKIMLPLAVPGIVTAGILIFINAWNDFLFAKTFLTQERTFTAPVAIQTFTGIGEQSEPWGQISAAAVVVTVPLIILVLVFQRRIVAGLTNGSVKG